MSVPSSIYLILSVLIFQSVKAQQITVVSNFANPFDITMDDCWSSTIYNNSPGAVEIRYELVVSEKANGLLVAVTSNYFKLPAGANNITASSPYLKPLRYLNVNPSFVKQAKYNASFPSGAYDICLKVYGQEGQLIAETCNEQTVEVMEPPHLISPADKDVLSEQNPFFIWSPPVLAQSCNVTYDFLIVEVGQDMHPHSAIWNSPKVFRSKKISSTIVQYPIEAPELEDGSRYAWTVVANCGNMQVPAEEVYTFTYKLPKEEEEPFAPVYIVPATQEGKAGEIRAYKGVVTFHFDNYYSDSQIEYAVSDLAGNKIVSHEDVPLENALVGEQNFALDLHCFLKKSGRYLIRINGGSGKGYFLYFYITEKDITRQNCD